MSLEHVLLKIITNDALLRRRFREKRASQTDRSDSEYHLRSAQPAQPEVFRHDQGANPALRQTANVSTLFERGLSANLVTFWGLGQQVWDPYGKTVALKNLCWLQVDPRWEVPRSHLILHEEIGSGEFGRVLRGTLTAEEQGTAEKKIG